MGYSNIKYHQPKIRTNRNVLEQTGTLSTSIYLCPHFSHTNMCSCEIILLIYLFIKILLSKTIGICSTLSLYKTVKALILHNQYAFLVLF
jgi:hypothetical protein